MVPPLDQASEPPGTNERSERSMEPDAQRPLPRQWPWFVAALLGAVVLFFTFFDWNLLRAPVERFASRATGRVVTIGHLSVKAALSPRVLLTDVTLSNADWAGTLPMAKAREVEFSVRLPTLLAHEIVVPYLRLSDADVSFLRDAQGRANWQFRREGEPGKRGFNVLTLTLDNAAIAYHDDKFQLNAHLRGATRAEGIYETRLGFAGQWRDTEFAGIADTGGILSLRGSTKPFPIKTSLVIGRTTISAEGVVADITRFRHIDTDFSISGPSLATLYPTLRLALPPTPPYRATGRLKRNDDHYSYEGFKGVIGNTDVSGDAYYELREPRPLLTATVKSQKLDIADLGPLVGLRPREPVNDSVAPAASISAPAPRSSTFPDRDFNLEKLNAMDADVHLTAASLRIPEQVPLENVSTHAKIVAGVLTLDPLNFGFAGGSLASSITLDARNDPIAGKLSIDMRRVRLSELFPTVEKMKQSGGRLGAQVRLTGRGNSIADLLASSNGTVTVGMAGGRISELSVWIVNLHGGEAIPLLFGGDRPARIRCGAAAIEVHDGVGTMNSFVFDTEESRIEGNGSIDLRNEQFDLVLRPESKKPGILSLRGPIHVYGGFRDPKFAVAPQSIARGVSALALGFVNPLLALLPLIETGPGEDADCREVLAPVRGALRQSGQSLADAPAGGPRRRNRESAPIIDMPAKGEGASAPIVDVPPKGATNSAPIVDVPSKK